jgi:hypothetical protein
MAVGRVAAPDWSCAPSSVRMSKAYGWTSSSCLRECRTLKWGTPSTPRMTARHQRTNLLNTEGNQKSFPNVSDVTGNSRIKMEGGLQNQVSDFNGLARKPLCYRYTIPQKQQQNQYIIESVYTGPGSNFLGPAGVSPSTRSVPVLASVRRGQLWLTERRDRGCASPSPTGWLRAGRRNPLSLVGCKRGTPCSEDTLPMASSRQLAPAKLACNV